VGEEDCSVMEDLAAAETAPRRAWPPLNEGGRRRMPAPTQVHERVEGRTTWCSADSDGLTRVFLSLVCVSLLATLSSPGGVGPGPVDARPNTGGREAAPR